MGSDISRNSWEARTNNLRMVSNCISILSPNRYSAVCVLVFARCKRVRVRCEPEDTKDDT